MKGKNVFITLLFVIGMISASFAQNQKQYPKRVEFKKAESKPATSKTPEKKPTKAPSKQTEQKKAESKKSITKVQEDQPVKKQSPQTDKNLVFGYRSIDWQLIDAVKAFDLERVKKLVSEGADVNAGGDLGYTSILSLSISSGDKKDIQKKKLRVIEYLIGKGADIKAKTKQGFGVLHNCERWDCPPTMFKFYLDKGADPNERNEKGETILFVVQKKGKLGYEKYLKSSKVIADNGKVAKTVAEAVEYNDLATLKKLVAEGKNVNERDAYFTPLDRAVREKKLAIAAYLLENGAKESLTVQVFQEAVRNGQLSMVKLLVKHGMAIKGMKPSPLFIIWAPSAARTAEQFQVLKYLVGQGADVNERTEEGVTLLYDAAIGSNKIPRNYILYIVSKGADVNALLGQDNTALSRSMDFDGNAWLASYLLQKRANPKIGNNKALFVLSMGPGNVSLAKLLARYGVNIKAIDSQGNTALHLAASGYAGVAYVKYLVSKGVKINQKNNAGETAYQLALKRTRPGAVEIRKYLKNLGAR